MTKSLIEIGFNKKGELDFGIRCVVGELTFAQMQELRSMITTVIFEAESMWRRNNLQITSVDNLSMTNEAKKARE